MSRARHRQPLCAALLMLAGVAGAIGSSGEARAQEGESGETAIERALRDQTRVGLRLKSLREKMERLAQRYDDEGRSRNATLLRSALSALDEQKLLDLSDQVERSLEQSNLSTVEQQDALAAGLDAVYSLLRDRKDADELARQANLAREGLTELSNLAENERRLLSATRATTDRKSDLTKQALDLAGLLERALQAAQVATQSLQSADQALGEAALAEQLAARQRAVAGEAQPTVAAQEQLEEALATLREQLAQPVQGGGLGDELLTAAEQSRDEARQSAADAAERMAAAREQLARAQAGSPSSAAAQSAAQAAAKPGESAGDQAGGKPGSSGEQSGAKPGDTSGKPSDSASGDAAASESDPASGEAASSESGGKPQSNSGAQPGSQAGEESAEQSGDKSGEQAGAKSGDKSGGKPAGKPGEKPSSPQDSAAQQLAEAKAEMQAAAQELDEVTAALDRSERSLTAARNRARAAALASSRQAETSGHAMQELAERLEAVAPEDGPELLDRTRKLLDELMQAAQAQQADQPQAAAGAQQSAQLSLAELLEMLKQSSQSSSADDAPKPTTPQALEDLAQRQDELQRRTRELMQRLKELPDQAFQEPVAKADQSMGGASSKLRTGDTQEAGRQQEDAAKQLEQAAQKLSGAADDYEQLRQDELLFRVGEELKGLLDRQKAVSAETKELDTASAGAERLSRSQRRTVVRLADEEKDLSTHSESVRATLEQDGAMAFAFGLARCRDDLSSAAQMLADEETGEFLQTIQGDVESQLEDLLAVLDAEIERRRNAEVSPPEPGGQGGQGGGQQVPKLVPKVAELLLIQRMEQGALARLDNFIRLNPAGEEGGLGPVERKLLERWSLEHIKVTELFESMVRKPGGAPQPLEVQGDGEAEGEEPKR